MFVRSDPYSGGYLRHPVASCTLYSCSLRRFAIRTRIESLRLPIQGFFFVACPWLHEQVIHSDEHLLGSGADVNV